MITATLSPRLAHLRAACEAAKVAEPADDARPIAADPCQWCLQIERGNSNIPKLSARQCLRHHDLNHEYTRRLRTENAANSEALRREIVLRGMQIFAARKER